MVQQQRIGVGKIIGVFGVKGWVKVFSDTSPKENILAYSPWYLEKGNEHKLVKVIDGRVQGKAVGGGGRDTDVHRGAGIPGERVEGGCHQCTSTKGEYDCICMQWT